MTPERRRGLELSGLAAVVLLGGGGWFLRSAPDLDDDPRLQAWRATVTRALPDVQPQIAADTVVLGVGTDREATAAVSGGSFTVSVICAGVGSVRVRLSSTGDDTGRPVPCVQQPTPVSLNVGLGTQFYLSMESASEAAVFRWRLTAAPTD